jgi:aerobic-type carbon monoxide dehydrogenase small subunit (CoxS/CutS family)
VTERLCIRPRVNGRAYEELVEPNRTLADFLRHDLGLTGTHVGCEHGVCGACTVLVNGDAIRSCLMLAAQADGCCVTTIEGVGEDAGLHPVQRAFQECHSFQCGFCAPGFVMSTLAFLERTGEPTRDEARRAVSSNICRCTGYHGIVSGVLLAAKLMRAGMP